MDDVSWDIHYEHGQCRTLGNGLVEQYVNSLAHGDPIQRIEVTLKDMAGVRA